MSRLNPILAAHSAMTFLINGRRGLWIGREGWYKPVDLLKEVDEIARDSAYIK
jgi:hypothetical protein